MSTLRKLSGSILGLGYGVILGAVAFFCTGLGHGTYIPLNVSSAPFSFFGVGVAFFSLPIIWGTLVSLLRNRRKHLFLLGVLIQYVSAVVSILVMKDEWSYISKVPELFLLWVLIFVGGQGLMWREYFLNYKY